MRERTIGLGQTPYKEILRTESKNPAIWDIFKYNDQGELVFKEYDGLKPVDLLRAYGEKFDAPIQITDLSTVTIRSQDLIDVVGKAAERTGYPKNKLQFHLAEKANFKAPVVAAALKKLNMETSGELGLHNFEWMLNKGLVGKDKKVICNGPKTRLTRFDKGYGHKVIELHDKGVNITPVLGPNELPFFQENVKRGVLGVAIRRKFGVVKSRSELDALVSPFGFNWNDVLKEADKIDSTKNLKFTMYHAMSSAASAVNPRAFATSALIAAEEYAYLKQRHPSLTHLNLGGGFPSKDTGYDHQAFLVPFLNGVKEICQKYGVELPTITIESGSFITTDAEHLVYNVEESYVNSNDNIPWLIVGGNLLNIPDIWVQEDNFSLIPANNANGLITRVRIHDLSCDSNSTLPTKEQLAANPGAYVTMTRDFKGLAVMAFGTGAYQDVLGGVGDPREQKMVNHCGLPEPIQVYLWKDKNGKTNHWGGSRASVREQATIVGFTESMLPLLK